MEESNPLKKKEEEAKPTEKPFLLVEVEKQQVEPQLPCANEESDLNWFETPLRAVLKVRHQEGCDCCWAIVAADNIAALWKKYKDEDISNSPQQLVDCVNPTKQPQDKKGCYQLSFNRGFQWIIDKGISLEQDYPPFEKKRGDCNMQIKRHSRLKAFVRIKDSESQEEILQKVKQHPIPAAMDIFEDFLTLRGEIYSGPSSRSAKYYGVHAIQIVGYGTDEQEKKHFWYILSSWGSEWGVNGVGRVDRSIMIKHDISNNKFRNLIYRSSCPILID